MAVPHDTRIKSAGNAFEEAHVRIVDPVEPRSENVKTAECTGAHVERHLEHIRRGASGV